jgi:solute carrier family 25, member 34/35
MIRNQLQSASVDKIAVGYQHKHDSFTQAFLKIYKTHGISGLYRGVLVTIPRGMMGSGTQIGTFGFTKDLLQRKYSENLDPTLISFISGSVAGTCMAIAMNPADVISTRLYNQGVNQAGKGIYYNGVIDCAIKIIKTEGIQGFYKGFWPHYVRLGPHSALVLVFFDELKSLKQRFF